VSAQNCFQKLVVGVQGNFHKYRVPIRNLQKCPKYIQEFTKYHLS